MNKPLSEHSQKKKKQSSKRLKKIDKQTEKKTSWSSQNHAGSGARYMTFPLGVVDHAITLTRTDMRGKMP